MNILHLLLTGQPGGIEVLAKNIALNSENRNIMYFIFSGGIIAEEMAKESIPVVIANTPRYRWKRKIEEFVSYCKEACVDVVVNHMESPVACAFILALKREIPTIKVLYYLHCDARDIVKSTKGKLIYRPIIRKMQECCGKVIAISEFVKQTGMEAYGLPDDKIEVIYNGVDITRFVPAEHVPTGAPMELFFVGRLIRDKGVHLLLEALSALPTDIHVHTTIVGYGAEYENLLKQASELGLSGKVSFLGKRTDISALLQKADYFVHPAICQEGFGITLVEAMGCGKPCIASRGGAVPEIIDDSSGILFELGSCSDLTRKIEEAYSLLRTQTYVEMCTSARQHAELFDINMMISKLEELYTL